MTMRCRNGQPHTHETVAESKACWSVGAVAVLTKTYAPATEGMYRMDGVIYKVVKAVHGSGRLYAKALDGDVFMTAPGMIRKLTQEHRMTAEQAKEYGALYGRCIRCQAQLTDEESIARGMGPVCAGKI